MKYYDEISEGYDELHFEEQKKKIELVKSLIKINKSDRLLDVGCGTGLSSDFDCDVTGIDPSEKLVGIAKEKGIICVLGNAESLPFEDSEFDIVISLTAAQNFNDIEKALSEIKRVGKDRFVLSILKRSEKAQEFERLIEKIFTQKITKYEEEKDLILIL